MRLYYVQSLSWNVAGQEIWPTLSINDIGQLGFKQDFERAWSAIEHKDVKACLDSARRFTGNLNLVLDEHNENILLIQNDHAYKLYRIASEEL